MKKFSLIIGICILLLGAGNGYGDMAFVANVDGNWDLFVADDMGKNPFQLTTTEYDEKDPCWSFDRKKIVYATSDGHFNIVDVESGEIHRVAETKLKTPKVCPCFSPDGKEIVFAQFRLPEQGDDTDLMVYYPETKGISRLLDQPAIQMWPMWSPDGARIAYANMHCSGECGSEEIIRKTNTFFNSLYENTLGKFESFQQ